MYCSSHEYVLVFTVISRYALLARLVVGGGTHQTGLINFTFENLESQVEVCWEVSPFHREEVELAKPFLIWHSPIGLHQPSALERWLPLHTPGLAALWHCTMG